MSLIRNLAQDEIEMHTEVNVTEVVPSSPVVRNKSAQLLTLFTPDAAVARRFIEFFTANVRNPNTRRAYAWAVAEFAAWCKQNGLHDVHNIEPIHVVAYAEGLQGRLAPPSIRLQLAALRMLFGWLVVGQVLTTNPARYICNPKLSAMKRKAPMLTAEETRDLLDSIDASWHTGLRDRALIALMINNFARVDVALKMRVEDVETHGLRTWIRLYEREGKRYDLAVQHNLGEYLHAYIEGAGLGSEKMGFLFRAAQGNAGRLSDRPMSQAEAWRMIERRAHVAGVLSKIGDHSF